MYIRSIFQGRSECRLEGSLKCQLKGDIRTDINVNLGVFRWEF